MSERPTFSVWWPAMRERFSAMAIIASMTLPAFGIRTYRTRHLEDPYGAEEPKERTYAPEDSDGAEEPKDRLDVPEDSDAAQEPQDRVK